MSENTERLPQQTRSRVTAEKFLEAAFKLLETQAFSELSVGDLARTAERSVGAFYQRFGSKDEFLSILITDFMSTGIGEKAAIVWQGDTAQDVFITFLEDTYHRIRNHRNLWHAALQMSSSSPEFWAQYGALRAQRFQDMLTAIEKGCGQKLSSEEAQRIAVAGQIFNSMINNQIINSPGPLSLDDDAFLPTMIEVALSVAKLSK